MAFLAGETITAGRLNRLQPATYRAAATSALAGAATLADVPGATVTFTSETANAVYVVNAVFDYRLTGTPTTLGSGNIHVDGVVQAEFAVFRDGGGSAGTSATVTQVYRGTLGAAGSHTIKLVASPVAGQQINIYSSITVTIYEVA
ncbi:hypothetical protein G9272_32025 [Streptomyces asoensis]|uniref:Uncharacterized protein n=1 Tax=Streptomyces asoensis TaxID=249586 RepID=A0A6M4WUZ6_9ACTN|nr:hypothetical protein [Streptomyces asoensis]QJT04347.1 hypothetical protein G9272_32025 [Streptomyces asoensis]